MFTTWELSLSCLSGSEKGKLHKQTFISFCGFLDALALRKDLFRRFHDHTLDQPLVEPSACDDIFLLKGVWCSYRFRNVIAELKGLSLLESSSGDEDVHFTIHPLVSEWIKCRMSPDRASAYTQDVCHLLAGSTSGPIHGDLQALDSGNCQFLAAHALECSENCWRFLTDCCLAAQGPLQDTEVLILRLIWLSGLLQNSLLISERAFQWKMQKQEPRSHHYFSLALHRTKHLRRNDRVNEAGDLLQELIDWTEIEASISVGESLLLVYDMAMSWDCMHRFKDALELLKSYCDVAVRELGREHWLYALFLKEMATACEGLNTLDDAESYAQEAHAHFLSLRGPDNNEVTCMEEALSAIYIKQEKYKEAVDFFEINIKKSETGRGLSHPTTLHWHLNMVIAYAELGRTDDALKSINLVF